MGDDELSSLPSAARPVANKSVTVMADELNKERPMPVSLEAKQDTEVWDGGIDAWLSVLGGLVELYIISTHPVDNTRFQMASHVCYFRIPECLRRFPRLLSTNWYRDSVTSQLDRLNTAFFHDIYGPGIREARRLRSFPMGSTERLSVIRVCVSES